MQPPYSTLTRRGTAAFLGGCLLALYLEAFILPWTPIYQGDSSPIFLFESLRMAHGAAIYRDFFELTLPGTQLYYESLFRLFGPRAWIPAITFVFLGGGLVWVGIVISRHLIKGPRALLPSLLFLALAYSSERDATHHWFSTLAVLGALAVLLPRRSPERLAAAGALCGIATLFTQTSGGLVWLGLLLFLIWEGRHARSSRFPAGAIAWMSGPYALVVLPVLAYYALKVGLARLFYCTILFPLKYFPLWYWNTPRVYLSEVPHFDSWLQWPAVGIWLSIYVLVPAIYFLVLVRYWRSRRNSAGQPWDKLMLINLVGLFLFLSVADSPSWLRMCTAALPGLVLLVWLAGFLPASYRAKTTWALAAAGLALAAAFPLMVQAGWHATLPTSAGQAAFLSRSRYDKFLWVRKHTHPGEYVFQASDCDLYFLLGLRDPTPVAFATSTGYTRPGQVREIVQALATGHVPYVLWSVWLDIPKHGAEDRLTQSVLSPLRAYVEKHYHLVRGFGKPDYEQVWELNRDSYPPLRSARALPPRR